MIPIILALIFFGFAAVALPWDKIHERLFSKRVVVLGARGVGKTTMNTFLASGSLPQEYKQTIAPEPTKARRFELRDLKLSIARSFDVSGDASAYATWKDNVDAADLVLYLVRADELIANDFSAGNRAIDDLTHIGGWIANRKSPPMFFIVGTHCDLDPNFASLTPDKRGHYADAFQNSWWVSKLVDLGGGTQRVKVALGSMRTIEDTEALVFAIFAQVGA